ncbi:hypothetical protein D9758_016126 [Tetrapyrgos nigripes]|uniref:Uncharacterized protein n=1 Tax=Tetrapyrgos nigripes TaxID=182062 RepID=A0A8H5C1L4_9AGAR|nr:hypothetical protein D9758_016126 [Tetrapyrgos nigripes]
MAPVLKIFKDKSQPVFVGLDQTSSLSYFHPTTVEPRTLTHLHIISHLFTMTSTNAERYTVRGKAAIFDLKASKVIRDSDYGRRIEYLARLKPELKPRQLETELARFEQNIYNFADASDGSSSSTPRSTPSLTPDNSPSSSRRSSISSVSSSSSTSTASRPRRSSFATKLQKKLFKVSHKRQEKSQSDSEDDEIAYTDRSMRILPGVKSLHESLSNGNDVRYAITSNGSTEYAFNCMDRVGITRPEVVVTAEDKLPETPKLPSTEPIILAAQWMGYSTRECIVFQDSPAGIRAGISSGAIVVASIVILTIRRIGSTLLLMELRYTANRRWKKEEKNLKPIHLECPEEFESYYEKSGFDWEESDSDFVGSDYESSDSDFAEDSDEESDSDL